MLKSGRAVIFGGTRGIGRAISVELAEKGYTVVVVGRNKDACSTVAATLPNAQNHIGVACDLSKPEGIPAACRNVEEQIGGNNIQVLVNCAGIVKDAICPRIQQADIQNQLNVNLVAPMLTCKYFSSLMMKQRRGCIVNIGSVVGSVGNAGQGVYSASKAGLVGFTKSTAKELARFGVSVNVVEPGFIDTDMTSHIVKGAQREKILGKIPLRRFGNSKEVAEAVLFLIANTYVTGQVLKVDGGLSLQF